MEPRLAAGSIRYREISRLTGRNSSRSGASTTTASDRNVSLPALSDPGHQLWTWPEPIFAFRVSCPSSILPKIQPGPRWTRQNESRNGKQSMAGGARFSDGNGPPQSRRSSFTRRAVRPRCAQRLRPSASVLRPNLSFSGWPHRTHGNPDSPYDYSHIYRRHYRWRLSSSGAATHVNILSCIGVGLQLIISAAAAILPPILPEAAPPGGGSPR